MKLIYIFITTKNFTKIVKLILPAVIQDVRTGSVCVTKIEAFRRLRLLDSIVCIRNLKKIVKFLIITHHSSIFILMANLYDTNHIPPLSFP